MEATTLADRRRVARARRRPPSQAQVREFPANGDGAHGPETDPGASELRLETTHDDGGVAVWFEDNWWLETIRRWKDRSLRIDILPTPDALLHPVVLHELEMVQRMALPWRIVGHCYLSDIGHPMLLPRLAAGPYDEVRIFDAARPLSEDFEPRASRLTITELFERVRVLQGRDRAGRPLLTRSPIPST